MIIIIIIIIIIIKLKLKISGWSSICGPRRSKGNWQLARGSVYTTWHGGCSTIFCRGICFALLLTHLLLNIGILAQSMQVSPKSYFSLLQWCQSKHKLSCWSAHRTWDNGEVMLDERQDQKEKCRGNKYNFCRAFVAEIQKNGVKIRKHARKYRSAGWSLFIKGAANSQRSAPAFTGKCRLVRRRGERQQVNAGNTQIRLKYEYKYTKYTRKDKKYTNTKIQTHTNTNITVGSLSWRRRRRKWDFSEKSSSRKQL